MVSYFSVLSKGKHFQCYKMKKYNKIKSLALEKTNSVICYIYREQEFSKQTLIEKWQKEI